MSIDKSVEEMFVRAGDVKPEDLKGAGPSTTIKVPAAMLRVVVESPYAGDIEKNTAYAKAACKDCMRQGEVPFASHLFFPQFLDESNPVERDIGIAAGYCFWKEFDKIVFYIDNGISPGMSKALERSILEKKPYEFRQLPKG